MTKLCAKRVLEPMVIADSLLKLAAGSVSSSKLCLNRVPSVAQRVFHFLASLLELGRVSENGVTKTQPSYYGAQELVPTGALRCLLVFNLTSTFGSKGCHFHTDTLVRVFSVLVCAINCVSGCLFAEGTFRLVAACRCHACTIILVLGCRCHAGTIVLVVVS